MYNGIKNDREIIDVYDEVDKLESSTDAWAYHNFTHALNVVSISEEILTKLNYSDDIIESVKIAALLHDTGATLGKDGHAERSYVFAKKYFEKNNIRLKYHDDILEAIRIHSDGFDTDNIIALALILADKLDITKDRVAPYGESVEGMRQLLYINNIRIDVNDNIFDVYIECDDEIDVNELLDFYFMRKVLRSVVSFSNRLNLKSNVYLNNDRIS